ncbi:hypothetical protein CRG98_045704 [Punica granatum]|uniref:AP2/ERF domain-containing protein n=1 Tax=Punica granatum TaxID=22663 RepID=A0A2I0HQ82_PUNGR|nr:hypothetical protein CRG98_045704 [Punica granatum]
MTTPPQTNPGTPDQPVKPKRGRRADGGNKYPVYRGVRMRPWGQWASEIRLPWKRNRIWLGTFATPEMAARAYDAAALAVKSRSATLNFPELAASLPKPASTAPHHIQAAATKAASMDIAPTNPTTAITSGSQSSGSSEDLSTSSSCRDLGQALTPSSSRRIKLDRGSTLIGTTGDNEEISSAGECSVISVYSIFPNKHTRQNSGSSDNLEQQLTGNEMKRKHMILNRESARQWRMRRQRHLDNLRVATSKLRVENGWLAAYLGDTVQL